MLQRAGRRMSRDPDALRDESPRGAGDRTVDSRQSAALSQALHPVMLDEIGFESALDQYLPAFEKQTGIEIRYERYGGSRELDRARSRSIFIA